MKDWIKKHWPLLLAIAVVLIVFFLSCKDKKAFKGEIKAKDKLIEQMMVEYQSLEDSAAATRKMAEFYKIRVLSYQDSLVASKTKLINQQKRYAKQMADLTRIPTDTLYVDVTGWLDSLSVHW